MHRWLPFVLVALAAAFSYGARADEPDGSIGRLRETFNRSRGSVRILALLSPT